MERTKKNEERGGNNMRWTSVSTEKGLSEAFLQEHAHMIDWDAVLLSQNKNEAMSESFVENLKDVIDWGAVARSQLLSFSFIKKNLPKLPVKWLMRNPRLRLSTIQWEELKFLEDEQVYQYAFHHLEELDMSMKEWQDAYQEHTKSFEEWKAENQ